MLFRPLGQLAWLSVKFFWVASFQSGNIFISAIQSAAWFASSILKDLRLIPRVHSCSTCLVGASSSCASLDHSATDDVADFLFTFGLDSHLQLAFQFDGICQLKILPHRAENVFWLEWVSNPRTHLCTRILDWITFCVCRFRPLVHPA